VPRRTWDSGAENLEVNLCTGAEQIAFCSAGDGSAALGGALLWLAFQGLREQAL